MALQTTRTLSFASTLLLVLTLGPLACTDGEPVHGMRVIDEFPTDAGVVMTEMPLPEDALFEMPPGVVDRGARPVPVTPPPMAPAPNMPRPADPAEPPVAQLVDMTPAVSCGEFGCGEGEQCCMPAHQCVPAGCLECCLALLQVEPESPIPTIVPPVPPE